MKRSTRIKKIDESIEYAILLENTLNKSELTEYTQTLNTGMDADEEKEIHIKKILNNSTSTKYTDIQPAAQTTNVIPLPQILKTDKIHTYQKYNRTKEYIKYEKDVPNAYIITEEDKQFLIKENLEQSVINNIIDNINNPHKLYKIINNTEKDQQHIPHPNTQEIISYLSRRTLLLSSSNDKNAYLCFRQRIIRSSRKSRRNEALCIDKLNRYNKEIKIINKIYKLKKEKTKLTAELEYINNSIYNTFHQCIDNNNTRELKRLIKDTYTNKKYKQPFYRTFNPKSENITDKIKELRNIMVNTKVTMDEQTLNEDAMLLYEIYYNNQH